MQDGSRGFGHALVVAAAALTAAMLIAPVVHRVNVELTCHLGGPGPLAMGRLHALPAPECDAGHWNPGSSRRAGP